MDKSCVPVAKLAASEKEVLKLWTKYLLSLVLAVIISMGLTRYGLISSTILQDYVTCGSFGYDI